MDIALVGSVAVKELVHDAVALGIGHELVTVADQPAGGDHEFKARSAFAERPHIGQLALSQAQLFDHGTGVFIRHVHIDAFHGFQEPSVRAALINDLCLADGKFVALAAHGLDQDGQMQLSAAGHLEVVRAVGLFDPQGNVRIQLAHQAVAQVAGSDIFALLSRERAVIDQKMHGDGGLGDLLEGDRFRI